VFENPPGVDRLRLRVTSPRLVAVSTVDTASSARLVTLACPAVALA